MDDEHELRKKIDDEANNLIARVESWRENVLKEIDALQTNKIMVGLQELKTAVNTLSTRVASLEGATLVEVD